MTRIGIPRALFFLQHYPMWHTFFAELGAETVVSPPTNLSIMSAGANTVADVSCLPIKVYAGHVAWLRDQGNVDAVFIPAIRSVEKDAFHCSKFQGLPDLIKATVPDCPPLIDIEIDVHRRKISPSKAFHRLGFQFTWNPLKVNRAWERACEIDEAYRALMVEKKLTYTEALAQLLPDVSAQKQPSSKVAPRRDTPLTLALVGHPYCLYDNYINHELVTRLRDMGIKIVTSEMLSAAETRAGIAHTTGQKRWFYEDWMSGAAGHYLYDADVDGIIAVLAFSCGPDSAMVETITRRAKSLQRPFMSLVIDEHGSAAGMVTRLEAFVDMVTRQKRQGKLVQPPRQPEVAPPTVLHLTNKPRLGFPRMGTVEVPLKAIFKSIGAEIELGPPLSSRTVSLGARYSPEFICTPYKYILGNLIEMAEAGANTLLYIDGAELCRMSCYTQLWRDVLRDLGYKVEVVTTAIFEDGGVFALPKFLRQFAPQATLAEILHAIRLGLAKVNILDDIERQVQRVRAREVDKGDVDKIWQEAIRRVDDAMDLGKVKNVKQDVLKKIDRVRIDPTFAPVRIATTGEYYAVLEPFFNLDLERELGHLGAEVHRTLMMGNWAKGYLVLEALGFPREPEIARAAKPYLRWDIAGEGWETIGQTVIHAKKGFDGIVEMLPFTCIPEVTALNILPRVSRELNIPVISFIFDEQLGRAGVMTRLEAFVDLLHRRRELRAA